MAQDYNKTINLPRTAFEMRAGLPKKEPVMLEDWKKNRLYEELIKHNEGKPKYVLHDGPPYANGNIHMGTALNKIIKDIIVRYKNMSGYQAPYVPGYDTHGLPIELKALASFGDKKKDISKLELRKICHDFATEHIGIMGEQFQRLGVIGDFDHPYLTLKPEFEARQIEIFGDMAKKGYDVYVFEALHEIGGVLKYGIPEFRLPNAIVDVEIENLSKMGVHFQTDVIVGKSISVDELEKQGFKGIFVASGAGLPNFMNIPGENFINIMSSNEYLTRVNLMDAANPKTDTPINLGKNVLVVGGGNTAMDSCRTAKRLGANVTLAYRRSDAELPARAEEVKHAKEEGINFMTLHNPVEYLADEKGAVKQAILAVMKLGEPDESGRRSPIDTGERVTIDCDQVVVAVGVSPNPLVPKSIAGLELGRKNTIAVGDDMQSSRKLLYAGGDIVRGGATVILAMGDGRRAAANMHAQLSAK